MVHTGFDSTSNLAGRQRHSGRGIPASLSCSAADRLRADGIQTTSGSEIHKRAKAQMRAGHGAWKMILHTSEDFLY